MDVALRADAPPGRSGELARGERVEYPGQLPGPAPKERRQKPSKLRSSGQAMVDLSWSIFGGDRRA